MDYITNHLKKKLIKHLWVHPDCVNPIYQHKPPFAAFTRQMRSNFKLVLADITTADNITDTPIIQKHHSCEFVGYTDQPKFEVYWLNKKNIKGTIPKKEGSMSYLSDLKNKDNNIMLRVFYCDPNDLENDYFLVLNIAYSRFSQSENFVIHCEEDRPLDKEIVKALEPKLLSQFFRAAMFKLTPSHKYNNFKNNGDKIMRETLNKEQITVYVPKSGVRGKNFWAFTALIFKGYEPAEAMVSKSVEYTDRPPRQFKQELKGHPNTRIFYLSQSDLTSSESPAKPTTGSSNRVEMEVWAKIADCRDGQRPLEFRALKFNPGSNYRKILVKIDPSENKVPNHHKVSNPEQETYVFPRSQVVDWRMKTTETKLMPGTVAKTVTMKLFIKRSDRDLKPEQLKASLLYGDPQHVPVLVSINQAIDHDTQARTQKAGQKIFRFNSRQVINWQPNPEDLKPYIKPEPAISSETEISVTDKADEEPPVQKVNEPLPKPQPSDTSSDKISVPTAYGILNQPLANLLPNVHQVKRWKVNGEFETDEGVMDFAIGFTPNDKKQTD